MTARIACLALTLMTLAACAPANNPPTPTLIVLGLSLPTTTPFSTSTSPPTATPIVIYTTTPTIEPPPTHTPTATPTASPTPRPAATSDGTQDSIPTATTAAPVTCQGAFETRNLLVNGGFEGDQHAQGSDSIQAPDGWSAFWQPAGTHLSYDKDNNDGYQRPEMRVIRKEPPYTNPPRILDGNRALAITGNQRAFDAGVYQKVTVASGSTLCLTGSAQAWSNRFSDDPFSSTLETLDDADNANFQLGIDPLGGVDPYSKAVQWGEVIHPYNIYKPMKSVQLTASGAAITVFVRGFMLWRFDHNELYLDSISLVKGGAS